MVILCQYVKCGGIDVMPGRGNANALKTSKGGKETDGVSH